MPNTFPVLPGLSWSVSKDPQFKTIVQKAVSGRELRIAQMPYPTYLFTLKYDFLRDNLAALADLRTLMGFYIQQQGSLTPFLYSDPTDFSVNGQNIGTGDGMNSTFYLGRGMPVNNGLYEFIQWLNVLNAVYLNGVLQPTGNYSVNVSPATITFNVPPGSGVVVTADFTYFFYCRFADDSVSFENFMHNLWSLKEIKLQSILV
jgi:uncharacterized protein (TIGR02217 family)